MTAEEAGALLSRILELLRRALARRGPGEMQRGLEVLDVGVDLALDGALVVRREAAALQLHLVPAGAEAVAGLLQAVAVRRRSLGDADRVAGEELLVLLAGEFLLRRGARGTGLRMRDRGVERDQRDQRARESCQYELFRVHGGLPRPFSGWRPLARFDDCRQRENVKRAVILRRFFACRHLLRPGRSHRRFSI